MPLSGSFRVQPARENNLPQVFAMLASRAGLRRAMDLDLVGRDPTPDGVGMSTRIIPAARTAVLTLVSLQLIALVHQSGPCDAGGRGAHAALSTSDVRRVGHRLSTVFSGTCQGPTACAAERANSGCECRGVARPVGSMRCGAHTGLMEHFRRCVVDVADRSVRQPARFHRALSPPGPPWSGQRIWRASWRIK